MGKLARINRQRREAEAARVKSSDASPQQNIEESPSDARLAGELDPRILACEKYDRFTKTRNLLRKMAADAGQWAGIPLAIEGEELVVDASYPFAEVFKPKRDALEQIKMDGIVIRNVLWSQRWRCRIAIYERDGKIQAQALPGSANSVDMEISTMGCSVAWGIEQESRALQLLGTLVRHHTFKYYLLSGQFLESSTRSGITYMFRKLRPTIAMKEHKGRMRVLSCLCLHPIAYYSGSWAGAMCPTDDVVAHLMLMRGDEHLYWKRANQIPAGRPTSGI